MKVARDKAFERLCKLEKGKVSGRLALIRKRHAESTKLPSQSVTQCNNTQWSVASSDGTREYTVYEETQMCPVNCHLSCENLFVFIRFPVTV